MIFRSRYLDSQVIFNNRLKTANLRKFIQIELSVITFGLYRGVYHPNSISTDYKKGDLLIKIFKSSKDFQIS